MAVLKAVEKLDQRPSRFHRLEQTMLVMQLGGTMSEAPLSASRFSNGSLSALRPSREE